MTRGAPGTRQNLSSIGMFLSIPYSLSSVKHQGKHTDAASVVAVVTVFVIMLAVIVLLVVIIWINKIESKMPIAQLNIKLKHSKKMRSMRNIFFSQFSRSRNFFHTKRLFLKGKTVVANGLCTWQSIPGLLDFSTSESIWSPIRGF